MRAWTAVSGTARRAAFTLDAMNAIEPFATFNFKESLEGLGQLARAARAAQAFAIGSIGLAAPPRAPIRPVGRRNSHRKESPSPKTLWPATVSLTDRSRSPRFRASPTACLLLIDRAYTLPKLRS